MCVGLMVQERIGILGMMSLVWRVMGGVRKLKYDKSAGMDEITGEMIKNGDEMVIDWIWKLCNKAFMAGIVPRDWRRAVIVLSLIHISEPTRLLSISYAVFCLKKKNKKIKKLIKV